MKYYDYVVKGEVIGAKERMYNDSKASALQIRIEDKFGQEISDTIWIEPFLEEEFGNDFYEKLSGEYYFAIKCNEKGYFYYSSADYFALKITDGTVYSLFKQYRVYVGRYVGRLLSWLPFYRFHTFTKMRTDTFEKKLKRILDEKRLNTRK